MKNEFYICTEKYQSPNGADNLCVLSAMDIGNRHQVRLVTDVPIMLGGIYTIDIHKCTFEDVEREGK